MATKVIPNDAPIEYLPDIDIHEADTEPLSGDEAKTTWTGRICATSNNSSHYTTLYIHMSGVFVEVGKLQTDLLGVLLRADNGE